MVNTVRMVASYGWRHKLMTSITLVIVGCLAAAGFTAAQINSGDGETNEPAAFASSGSSTTVAPTTTTTTVPVKAEELCTTIADEGFTLTGDQVLATLAGAGTQVRGGTVQEAAEAYLAAIAADAMKVAEAEFVYQPVGINASRILGSTSDNPDVEHELERLLADKDHLIDVCTQTVLEAQRSLDAESAPALDLVVPDQQVTVNLLVHDEQSLMLPRWVCEVPVPEDGISILSYGRFVDPEIDGTAVERVQYSMSQRAYVDLDSACPAGGVNFADIGEFQVMIVEDAETEVSVSTSTSTTSTTSTTAPTGTDATQPPSQGGSEEPTPSAPAGPTNPQGPSGPTGPSTPGGGGGAGGQPGGGPAPCTGTGPGCPGPGPGGGGGTPEPCPGGTCPGPGTSTTVPAPTTVPTTTVPPTTTQPPTTTVPPTTTQPPTTTIPVTTTTVFRCPPGTIEDPDNPGYCKVWPPPPPGDL